MTIGVQRITQRSLNDRVGNNLQHNLGRMAKLQQQLSSGRLISRPSDSPTGAVSALRLRSDIRRTEQYERNAADGKAWLGRADNALTETLSTVRKARDLALRAVNASTSPTDRVAIAAEVAQLREHAMTLANTSYLGQPVFGGTASGERAYDPATGSYLGDDGILQRTVASGIDVQVSVPGTAVFGTQPDDLFAVIGAIEDHLAAGDPAVLSADVQAIDRHFLGIQSALSLVGARFQQVEALGVRAESDRIDATSRLAEVESIDLPETIMELQLQEVAYQASLGAASRVL
jgi:flagellar hook-associated protein 3 FlgL